MGISPEKPYRSSST